MRRGRRRRRRLRSFDSRLRISRLRGEDNAPSRSTGGGGGEEEGRGGDGVWVGGMGRQEKGWRACAMSQARCDLAREMDDPRDGGSERWEI